jgi:Ser/Thr protein kinase RdoA (MazF antagonist)
MIRRDLPAGFYRQLPKLATGPLRGYPRVYGIAWAIVAHTDNSFDLDALYGFCRAYQRVQPLTIGELWALAITLRVVLIDNLSRLAAGIVHRLALREKADTLADELLRDDARLTPHRESDWRVLGHSAHAYAIAENHFGRRPVPCRAAQSAASPLVLRSRRTSP